MQTLSKNKISHIASLQQKKYRTEYHEFLVEGTKSVEDFLRSGFEPSIVVIAQEELLSIFDVKEEIVFSSRKGASENFRLEHCSPGNSGI